MPIQAHNLLQAVKFSASWKAVSDTLFNSRRLWWSKHVRSGEGISVLLMSFTEIIFLPLTFFHFFYFHYHSMRQALTDWKPVRPHQLGQVHEWHLATRWPYPLSYFLVYLYVESNTRDQFTTWSTWCFQVKNKAGPSSQLHMWASFHTIYNLNRTENFGRGCLFWDCIYVHTGCSMCMHNFSRKKSFERWEMIFFH